MSLLNINPTSTASWKELQGHFEEIKDVQMKSLFLEDSNRKKNMSRNFEDLNFDFSKNRLTEGNVGPIVKTYKRMQAG